MFGHSVVNRNSEHEVFNQYLTQNTNHEKSRPIGMSETERKHGQTTLWDAFIQQALSGSKRIFLEIQMNFTYIWK